MYVRATNATGTVWGTPVTVAIAKRGDAAAVVEVAAILVRDMRYSLVEAARDLGAGTQA